MQIRHLFALLLLLTLPIGCDDDPGSSQTGPSDDAPDASDDTGEPGEDAVDMPDGGEPEMDPMPDPDPVPTQARCDEDHDRLALEVGQSIDGLIDNNTPSFGDSTSPGVPVEVTVPEGISAWAIVDWPSSLEQACVGRCNWISPEVLDEACAPIASTVNRGGSSRIDPPEPLVVKSVRVDGTAEPRTVFLRAATSPAEGFPVPYRLSLIPMVCFETWPALEDGVSDTLTQDDAPVFVQASPSFRRDGFQIDLEAGAVSRWRMNTDSPVIGTIRIFSPSCEPVGGWSSFDGTEPTIEINAVEAGTYTVTVEANPADLGEGVGFALEALP